MLSPLLLATWIATCLPMADPTLAHALVQAGSAGDPWLVSDRSGAPLAAKDEAAALALLAKPAKEAIYIGLTQIPAAALAEQGLGPDAALEPCANLRLGYAHFTAAYDYAGTLEKTPWKRLAVAFSWYRVRQRNLDGDYVKKATDFAMKGSPAAPAPFGSRTYMAVAAEATAGIARLAARQASVWHQRGQLAAAPLASRSATVQ